MWQSLRKALVSSLVGLCHTSAVSAEASLSASGKMERFSGKYTDQTAFKFSKDISYEECERLCFAETRCVMIEYYSELRSCGLYDHSSTLEGKNDIVIAIKRANDSKSPPPNEPANKVQGGASAPLDPLAACNSNNPPIQIEGCTAIITTSTLSGTDQAITLSRRADAYVATRAYDKAISDLRAASTLEPENTEHKKRLVNALLAHAKDFALVNDWSSAIADLRDALVLVPEHANSKQLLLKLIDRRALDHLLKDELDLAITDYTQALGLDPENVELLVARGTAHGRKHQDEVALADFNKAIKRQPTSAIALLQRGDHYFRKNNLTDALADFSAAIKLLPKNSAALLRRGLAYEKSDNRAKAEQDFRSALKLDPKNAIATVSLARVQKMQTAERARSNTPNQVPDGAIKCRVDHGEILCRSEAPSVTITINPSKPRLD